MAIQSQSIRDSSSRTTRASESGAEWGLVSAGTLIVIAPLMVVFLLFQRLFIESFTQSGLKG